MSNMFSYREDHKRRLSNMTEILNNIKNTLNILPKLEDVTGQKEIEDKLKLLETKVYQRLQRVSNPFCRVCVIGREKQGKSTFVNAWVGKEILPSDVGRCTWAASTIINSPSYRLEAEFITSSAFSSLIDELYKQMDVKRPEHPFPIKDTSFFESSQLIRDSKQYKELLKLSETYDKFQKYFNQKPLIKDFGNLNEMQDGLYDYIALKSREGKIQEIAYAIKHANIYVNLEVEADFCIDDLPGINAPGNRAEQMTWKAVEEYADLVVLVKNATDNASLDRDEENVWDRAVRADTSISLSDRLFVVLNKADFEQTANNRNCHCVAADEFVDRGISKNRIFFCSSQAELYERYGTTKGLSFEYKPETHDSNKSKVAMLYGGSHELTTGFAEFKDAVASFIKNDLRRLEEDALNSLTREFNQLKNDILGMLSTLENASFSADSASSSERKRFEDLWDPKDPSVRDNKGLRAFLNKKLLFFVRGITESEEEKKRFIGSIQEQIEKCKDQFKSKITIDDLNYEDGNIVSPLRDLANMRQGYQYRKFWDLKKVIYNDLANSLSKSVKETLIRAYNEMISATPPEDAASFSMIGDDVIKDGLNQQKDNFFAKNILYPDEEVEILSGFEAILTSIAYAPLQYLVRDVDREKKLQLMSKAHIYREMVANPAISGKIQSMFQDSAPSAENIGNFCKVNSDLIIDILSTFIPGGPIVKQVVSKGASLGIDKYSTLIGGAKQDSKKMKQAVTLGEMTGASKNIADPQQLTEESIIAEMHANVDLFFEVLQSMLFDEDFGFWGYYLGILEKFRVEAQDVVDNAFNHLAFRHRTVLWPNEDVFHQSETRKELQLQLVNLQSLLKKSFA